MKKELASFEKWLKELNKFSIPSYSHLPDVDLYMEQVLSYLDKSLAVFKDEDNLLLTSFMINNYVKAKIIVGPKNKKYDRNQIGYLISICVIKQILSMSNISLLFEMDKLVSDDKEKLYNFFKEIDDEIVHSASKATLDTVEVLNRKYQSDLKKSKKVADDNLRSSLGYIALRASIEASINKMIADKILNYLNMEVNDDKSIQTEKDISTHDIRRKIKVSENESERIAKAKKHREKLARKKQGGK